MTRYIVKLVGTWAVLTLLTVVLGAGAALGKTEVTQFTPAGQMLQSAGRDPLAAQPEEGFTLSVPAEVLTGDPFVVGIGGKGLTKVSITWRGKTVNLTPDNAAKPLCEAAFGVPLDVKETSFPMVVTTVWGSRTETMRADIPVKSKSYPVQSLKVDQKYVTPPAAVQEKIKQDRAHLSAAVGVISTKRYWSLPMLRPVPGTIGSVFGLRRVFNGKPLNPHKGLDFHAESGDSVKTAENGVVVLAEEQYYGGNTVIVDHGLGVFTLYLHLSAFTVSVGQQVTRGDIVGLVGATGRVTGPHLHFSLMVLGDSLNPAAFLPPL